MILSGPAIAQAVAAGEIVINPFDPRQLNAASYDLRLGDQVRVYGGPGGRLEEDTVVRYEYDLPAAVTLDSRQRNPSQRFRLAPSGFTVKPGRVFLMNTFERIFASSHVPIIDGKSSIGRLGVTVHVTAGFGDPGFDGQYTLEVVALGEPVVLYPGMRIAQVRFHRIEGDIVSYQDRGHYVAEHAQGPVASRSYLQFRDDES